MYGEEVGLLQRSRKAALGQFQPINDARVMSACPLVPQLQTYRCVAANDVQGQQRTDNSHGRAACSVTPPSPDGGTFVPRRDRIGREARWIITCVRRPGIVL